MNGTITLPRSVLEQALEILDSLLPATTKDYFPAWLPQDAIDSLKCRDSVRAALEQPDIEIPASVPEGWKLVPVEPTDDMLYDIQEYSHILPPRGRRIWAHMLAAAPQPPVVEQPQVEQEPVAWLWIIDGKRHSVSFGGPNSNTPKDWIVQPLYTHPQPKRQPLTDAEILMVLDAADIPDLPRDFKDVDIDIARAIERAHGIGGEA